MKVKVFEPDELRWPGVGVFTQPPFASTWENVSPRLRMTANELGAVIIGSLRPGTGATVFDR